MVLMAGTIFVLFFSVSVEMLVVGNILCGIPWGIFQTLTTGKHSDKKMSSTCV